MGEGGGEERGMERNCIPTISFTPSCPSCPIYKSVTVTKFHPGNTTLRVKLLLRNMPPKLSAEERKRRQEAKTAKKAEKEKTKAERKAAMGNKATSRAYAITCNCDQEVGHWPFMDEEGEVLPIVKYLIIDQQIAPNTQKYHKQGFVIFKDPIRWWAAKKFAGCKKETKLSAHIEIPRESWETNRNYCLLDEKKTRLEGTHPVEWGEWHNKMQGFRSDICNMFADIDEGKSLKEIVTEHKGTWARNHNAVDKYIAITQDAPYDRKEPRIYLWVGPPGSGKTKKAKDFMHKLMNLGYDVYMPKLSDGGFWAGYTGQKVIFINNFQPYEINKQDWLRIADHGPEKVKTKGGFPVWLKNEYIIMSSTTHPESWWPHEKGDDHSNYEVTRRFETGKITQCERIAEEDMIRDVVKDMSHLIEE